MGLITAGMALTPTQLNEGRVVKGVRITNAGNPIATTSSTTELDITKWALTGLNLTSGRRYLYRAVITWTKTVAGDTFEFRLRTNTPLTGSLIGISPVPVGAGDTSGWTVLDLLLVGSATWTSLYLSVVRVAGTGTLSYYGATGGGQNRGWAALYDAGDTSNWTDAV